ncbi:MAG: LacI family DNA-binding transcriptional regulator [Pseudomonadota bacterium]
MTSIDVAKLAEVSQSAVSRTFTPGASVSDATRERVMAAASELGYRPNALARAMISGRSRLIAILVAYLENQFYPVVLEKLSRALQADGYQVLLFMTDPGGQDEVVRRILQYQVQGILMASATMSSNLANECAETGIPVVMLNRYVANTSASSVTSDNIEGGRMVADFLVRTGHKRIAYIAGIEDSSTNRDREAGFYSGLADHGLVVSGRSVGNYTFEGATHATRELFSRPVRPDAVFVANDHMAFAVMDVIRSELGLRIPEDVSIIGYDNVPEASWNAYGLTTVEQHPEEMARMAINILLEQVENRTVTKRAAVLPAKLIVRSSVRTPG